MSREEQGRKEISKVYYPTESKIKGAKSQNYGIKTNVYVIITHTSSKLMD